MNFFATAGSRLDNSLPDAQFINSQPQAVSRFTCTDSVSVMLVADLVDSIDVSKSSCCDMISSRIYKDALGALVEQITYLFNMLSTGVFPTAWKKGVVTPIPKKGDITKLDNIRPITQTHFCGKFFEKIVNSRIMNYLETNG